MAASIASGFSRVRPRETGPGRLYKRPAMIYRIGFFHPIGGIPMSKHKKHERHKELDRRRKRRKERLKERVRQAIAAKKA